MKIKKASIRMLISGIITWITCSFFIIICGIFIPFKNSVDTISEFSVIITSFFLLLIMMLTFINKWVIKAEINDLFKENQK
jgi:uncharacterized membrane protein YdfJ with MMPL/SSD domain